MKVKTAVENGYGLKALMPSFYFAISERECLYWTARFSEVENETPRSLPKERAVPSFD
jgi:hypothetical protein